MDYFTPPSETEVDEVQYHSGLVVLYMHTSIVSRKRLQGHLVQYDQVQVVFGEPWLPIRYHDNCEKRAVEDNEEPLQKWPQSISKLNVAFVAISTEFFRQLEQLFAVCKPVKKHHRMQK